MSKALVKSSTNRMISGVCGGIAQTLDVDPTIVRVLFVIATILGIGSPVLIYFILALLMPSE